MKLLVLSMAATALGLTSMASAAATYQLSGGNFSYTEDFEGWGLAPYAVPNGTAASNYWTSTGEHWYANNYWASGYRLWMSSQNYNTDPWTTPGNDGVASLQLASLASVAGLEQSNLVSGLNNVTLKADVAFSFARQPWWIGPDVMGTRLWLLNDNGDGYMGQVTADGRLSLFTADNGVATGSALATGGSADLVATNAMQHLSLSAVNGVVTLTLNDSAAFAAASNADTLIFTKIAIEGYYLNQQHNVDNVVLTGTTVPEAASLGLMGLGALSLLRRSRW